MITSGLLAWSAIKINDLGFCPRSLSDTPPPPNRPAFKISAVLFAIAVIAAPSALDAQTSGDHGVIADDDLTIVAGTRFVIPEQAHTSPTALFRNARVPLASFNDADRCIDETALEVAKDYFASLGRALGKAGYYYFIPDDEVDKAISMCGTSKGPPQAFIRGKTKILAFGKVVPTSEAHALEESIR